MYYTHFLHYLLKCKQCINVASPCDFMPISEPNHHRRKCSCSSAKPHLSFLLQGKNKQLCMYGWGHEHVVNFLAWGWVILLCFPDSWQPLPKSNTACTACNTCVRMIPLFFPLSLWMWVAGDSCCLWAASRLFWWMYPVIVCVADASIYFEQGKSGRVWGCKPVLQYGSKKPVSILFCILVRLVLGLTRGLYP